MGTEGSAVAAAATGQLRAAAGSKAKGGRLGWGW
jgi:hypothetical protein